MLIRGDGVAASCCAYLLGKTGFHIELETVDRPRLPVILLGDRALALVRDIFGKRELLADAPRVRKRVVAWGPRAAPVTLEHSALIVAGEDLLDAIRPAAAPTGGLNIPWTIHAARPLPAPATCHCFGSRLAQAVAVSLKPHADSETCWIESLGEGWLFLIPGWLLAVGNSAEFLLSRSRVVAAQIASCDAAQGSFPAYARIASLLAGPGWLASGTAAMAFDPICGDGTAHAVREAILASAVLRAIASGGNAPDLLAHYQARLTAGFQRHLLLCREFYRTGGNGPFWQSELEAIDRGIEWCKAALAEHGVFRYGLRGLELEPLDGR